MAFFEDSTQEQVNNSLWVEKYRPKKLDEYVGNEHLKQKVRDYLSTGDVPHLLFFGKAGTGKTTLAKLIVNSINCDYIIINASDENNVDTFRDKIRGFASSMGFRKWKVIILDEPTKGIDIGSKAAVHDFMAELAAQGLAVIMVSSEIPEIVSLYCKSRT